MRIIEIFVDLTEAHRNLIQTFVEFPVQPGTTATFTTPLWIQESHRDNGPVAGIAGLVFVGHGKELKWHRNPKAANEYCVEIPADVRIITTSFTSSINWKVTRRLSTLGWEYVLLHPNHKSLDKVLIQPSIIVPKGWGAATALQNMGEPIITDCTDDSVTLRYQPTNVERLADSPVLIGKYFTAYALTKDDRHFLCVAADTEEYANVPQETLKALSRLVHETTQVFGARHYDTYRFLVALTDFESRHGGSEHHDSVDACLPRKALSDSVNLEKFGADLAHEFVHSWNGKYRRPAGHLPHDFVTPLDGRLLWVYEGLTEYYGNVISARCGILSLKAFLAKLAEITAMLDGQTGRRWRSLEDTGTGSCLRGSSMWANWTRGSVDYYYEGVLLWLEVDTVIRSETRGKHSLDDFAKHFFGQGRITGPVVVIYTLNDVKIALNKILQHDWDLFFEERVKQAADLNLRGIHAAGYRFVYMKEPDEGQHTEDATKDAIWNSIGVKVTESGQLEDVKRFGPADNAKLAPRQTISKVGQRAFSINALADEIKSVTVTGCTFIRLVMTHEDDEWEVELDYQSGLRYPRLERTADKADIMAAILEKKSSGEDD